MLKGLIIQGPLFSPGYGPYEFQTDLSFEKSWIEYDCRENILATIEMAKRFFDHIVIATWENADYTNFLKSIGKDSCIEIVVLHEGEKLSELHGLGIHKYHQIETLRAGASRLEELGCDVVAKIRTDHALNLQLLSKQLTKHQNKNLMSLGVPNINLFELDRLTDFYFVGRPEVIRDMCNFYMSKPETCVDTHKDYFLNFATFLSNDENLVAKVQAGESKLVRDYYSILIWTRFFYPLHGGLFKNFSWRGKMVNYRLNGWIRWFHAFHSSQLNSSKFKFAMNLFVILLVRELKRPTIRFSSAVLFRIYRLKSARAL